MPTDAALPMGLTFDDVLLQPAESDVVPSAANTSTRLTRDVEPRHPAGLQRHGHRHRGPDGDRDGPPGRHRRAAPQPVDGGSGAAGRPGEAVRGRHGDQPGHLQPGRHPRRRRRALRPLPDLRRAGGGPRRDAGRHRHQPRHAIRHRHVHPGPRRDDPDAVDHRAGRGQQGRGAGAAAPAQGREAAAGRRRRSAARPDHRQGLHQERAVPARHQGRGRPAAGRRRGRGRATTRTSGPAR